MKYFFLKNVFFNIIPRRTSLFLFAWCCSFFAQANEPLTEIVVTAELLETSVLELPISVSVIDAETIDSRTARHLEDLLNMAPNVNYATGASRGRFVQIRGIGERSEFQEPIINSIGLLIDGIDFTGIATAASTLDIQQVEILRGPQGTLYGANALAGLINVVSNKPVADSQYRLNMSVEDHGGLELGGVVNGAITQNAAYRLAVKHYASDGFTENVFLDRDDTNNIDETTARLRISSELSERVNLDFTLLNVDIENGYDAFSLDNTRQTYSDEPGVDQQKTAAASAQLRMDLNDDLRLDASLSHANSELRYRYDEDWSHVGICENTSCDSDLFGFDWFYSSVDDYQRDNKNTSLDIRLVNNAKAQLAWVAGLYFRDQKIDLLRQYTFADADFTSALATTNSAVYGQADWGFSDQWSVSVGLRFEQRKVDYADNNGAKISPSASLWGGRIALEYHADSGAFYYGLISRGYKAGGFNLEPSIGLEQREFDTETMLNYELGVKRSLLDDRLSIQAALFYQDRDDIQSKQSIVRSIETGAISGPCPCSFADFTDNAASGRNQGVEVTAQWQVTDTLNFYATAGVLDAKFDDFFSFDHVNADRENGIPFNLKGREQAHAPGYQWVLGGAWQINHNWRLIGSIEAKDDFFFSDRHSERSAAYELLNLELAYQRNNWKLAVYGKNLTDELVKTRGFGSFGNDPRKFYVTESYNQFAAPRVVGIKGSIEF